jgi:hypothetical protein
MKGKKKPPRDPKNVRIFFWIEIFCSPKFFPIKMLLCDDDVFPVTRYDIVSTVENC